MAERECRDCGHPVGWDQPGECPRNMQNYQSEACKSRQVEALRSRIAKLEAELDEWRTSASMACENPASGCDCSGCRFAEQHQAGDAAKAELERVKGE